MDTISQLFIEAVIDLNCSTSDRSNFAKLSSYWGDRATYVIKNRIEIALYINFAPKKGKRRLERNREQLYYGFYRGVQNVSKQVFDDPRRHAITNINVYEYYRTNRFLCKRMTADDAEKLKQILVNNCQPIEILHFEQFPFRESGEFWDLIDVIPAIRRFEQGANVHHNVQRMNESIKKLCAGGCLEYWKNEWMDRQPTGTRLR
ncbi:hypothetical protein QR680_011093 [Steinernema hermaphroditum]|uniref:Uncharacterized protein n=1 Tax=Steinernema hermaphroditum TaxID=289476 RepID=A0AA39ITV9_9BILA|nr:hypothetical protein QR680_011093 [Steinernema hermaphroditum]